MSMFNKRAFYESMDEKLSEIFELFVENGILEDSDDNDDDADLEDAIHSEAFTEAKELHKILIEIRERVEGQI